MINEEAKIRQRLYLTNPDVGLVEAADNALSTGNILKSDNCPVLDSEGNPLEREQIYRYRDVKIKVRDWTFGAGNMLERYYRVYYTDENLRDTFLVVPAKYPSGVFYGAVYQSELIKS